MVRPVKQRLIHFELGATYFKPRGIPLSALEEVDLTIDETEALRLCDFLNLDQIKAAKKMKISQSTLGRILFSARKKVATALIEGKAIKIKGGIIKMQPSITRKFKCEKCKHEWEMPFGTGKKGIEMACPKCNSKAIHRIDHKGHGFGKRWWGRKKWKGERK